MSYQTTVVRPKALRRASAKIEIGNTLQTMANIGAIRSLVSQEQWELVKIMADNVGEITRFIKNHINTVSFNWLEIDFDALAAVRGGIDTISTIAGTLVEGHSQLIPAGEWKFGKFIRFENQNGDGSAIDPTSVTAGTNGALTEGEDYIVGQNEVGMYGIFIMDSETVTTENQSITVAHDYTPNAARVFETGGLTQISPKIVRLTNTNELGKKLEITIHKASNSDGINIAFPADDSDDLWNTPIKLEGVCDATRDPGKQLMRVVDEQSVA